MKNNELIYVANNAKNLYKEMSADRHCQIKFTKAVEWINEDLMNIIQK